MTPIRRTAWTLIAVGAALRLLAAARLPFEQDELYTIDEATHLLHTKLLPGVQARPVFFLLEHPFVTSLAPTPLALRILALVFGVAGLWAVWRLARMALDDAPALVVLAFAVISPWQAYASAFARYYSLLFLLAALVYWLVPRAYDSDRPGHYLQALAPLLLGAWTHPSFVFPVVGAALGLTIVAPEGNVGWRWPSRAAWLYLWGPLLTVSLLGLAAIRVFHIGPGGVANGADRGLAAALRLLPAVADWTTPVVVVAGIAGAVLMVRSGIGARRRLGAMVLLSVAATSVALLALSFVTAIYADYAIAALPLVLVGAGGVFQWLTEMLPAPRRGGAAALVAGLIAIGVLPAFVSFLSDGTRFDYRPAFTRIEATAPGTAVLTWPIVLQRFYAPQLRGYELSGSPARLDSLLARERDLWAVASVKRYGIAGDNGEIAAWLRGHCRPVAEYHQPRFDYRMYRVDLWRCGSGAGL